VLEETKEQSNIQPPVQYNINASSYDLDGEDSDEGE